MAQYGLKIRFVFHETKKLGKLNRLKVQAKERTFAIN